MTKPLRLLVLQYAREGPPGLIGEAAAARGATLDLRLPHEGAPLPDGPEDHDGLILLGGAMSATDDHLYPHFPALLALIRAYPAAGRPVLGVCLGAQLIARAWGAAVYPHSLTEFGYVALTRTAEAARDPLLAGLPERLDMMQWHEDTFELPAGGDLPGGATLLLEGAVCRNQALRVGELVYGFQCHFEVDEALVRTWTEIRAQLAGLAEGPLATRMAAEWAAHGAAGAAHGRHLAERWLDLAQTARRDRG